MGKTYRKYKGKKYKPNSREQQKTDQKDKFMGFTSGTHSRGDNPQPEKFVDYVKYNYPNDFRGKTQIIAQRQRSERKNERLIIEDELNQTLPE